MERKHSWEQIDPKDIYKHRCCKCGLIKIYDPKDWPHRHWPGVVQVPMITWVLDDGTTVRQSACPLECGDQEDGPIYWDLI